MRASVGIIGASGYSGMELTRLLLAHPQVSVQFVTSDRWVGQSIGSKTGLSSTLAYVSNEQGLNASDGCALVFLATPAETSLALVPSLRERGLKVVDLSGAFRLKDLSLYPQYYQFEHTHPARVNEAVYGLPELFRGTVRQANLVANPGCYATAAALACAPLLRAEVIDAQSLVINAASGVSGAGRKASEDYSFMEIDGDFRLYKPLTHQHIPEIEQTLGGTKVVFLPHLLPVKRGILSTAVARLKKRVSPQDVAHIFHSAYASEPLVRVTAGAESVRLAEVVRTPWCVVGATANESHVVCTTAIDNLLKGAASQAVQNMNLMLGFDETSGLQTLKEGK
jgi:N-acetyl-gamma-glutamyl-phosphate reductase